MPITAFNSFTNPQITIRNSVGKNAQGAAARRLKKEAELNARNHGVAVVPEQNNGRRLLPSAAKAQVLAGPERHG